MCTFQGINAELMNICLSQLQNVNIELALCSRSILYHNNATSDLTQDNERKITSLQETSHLESENEFPPQSPALYLIDCTVGNLSFEKVFSQQYNPSIRGDQKDISTGENRTRLVSQQY